MEYLIHFEDGSEGYLAHHGIKGMKWGVWNAETASRYRGGDASTVRGARKTARAINKLDERRAVEIGKAGKEHAKGQKALGKAQRYREMGNEKQAHGYEVLHMGRAARRDKHLEAAYDIDETRKKMLSTLQSDLYKVNVKDVPRSTISQGKQLLMGSLIGPITASTIAYLPKNTTPGEQVSIKKRSKSEMAKIASERQQGQAKKAWENLESAKKDFDNSHPAAKKLAEDYKAGKLTKAQYDADWNRAWQDEVTKSNSKYAKAYRNYNTAKQRR